MKIINQPRSLFLRPTRSLFLGLTKLYDSFFNELCKTNVELENHICSSFGAYSDALDLKKHSTFSNKKRFFIRRNNEVGALKSYIKGLNRFSNQSRYVPQYLKRTKEGGDESALRLGVQEHEISPFQFTNEELRRFVSNYHQESLVFLKSFTELRKQDIIRIKDRDVEYFKTLDLMKYGEMLSEYSRGMDEIIYQHEGVLERTLSEFKESSERKIHEFLSWYSGVGRFFIQEERRPHGTVVRSAKKIIEKISVDDSFLDSLARSDCVLNYTTWPIRKSYYLNAKQEISKDILDKREGFSRFLEHSCSQMPTENDTHEDRALYIAKILKDFCEIHPVIRAPFIAGNYHPLSLAASSEDANFNPEYEE